MKFSKLLALVVTMLLMSMVVVACNKQDEPIVTPEVTPVVTPEATVDVTPDVTPAATEEPVGGGGGDGNGNQITDTPTNIDWSTIEVTPAEAFEYEIFIPSEFFTNKVLEWLPGDDEFLGGLSSDMFLDYYKTVPQDIKDTEAVVITGYDFSRKDTIIRIPDEIDGRPVLIIGIYSLSPASYDSVRYRRDGVEHVTEAIYIPDSVIIISKYAFYELSTLSEIRLPNPDSSLYIDEFFVFDKCKSLIRIDYPDNLYLDGKYSYVELGGSSEFESLEVITFPATAKNVVESWREYERVTTHFSHEIVFRD